MILILVETNYWDHKNECTIIMTIIIIWNIQLSFCRKGNHQDDTEMDIDVYHKLIVYHSYHHRMELAYHKSNSSTLLYHSNIFDHLRVHTPHTHQVDDIHEGIDVCRMITTWNIFYHIEKSCFDIQQAFLLHHIGRLAHSQKDTPHTLLHDIISHIDVFYTLFFKFHRYYQVIIK